MQAPQRACGAPCPWCTFLPPLDVSVFTFIAEVIGQQIY
jgi:hypothetical protein